MLGALGITGGLICTATMVLPALGAAGAAAGGMQGMTSGDEPPHDGLLGILTDAGPAILIVSTLLVTTLGVGLRRPLATVPPWPQVQSCTGGCTPSPATPSCI